MGFLDFFFKKPLIIEHEFFGIMKFREIKSMSNFFECSRHFAPSNKNIEITLEGDATGPTQNQIDFYISIENNYESISKSIIPLIEDEFGNWEEDFKIIDFKNEFEPEGIDLPKCNENPIKWEISFGSDHDRNHVFSLTMSNFEAIDILIDG